MAHHLKRLRHDNRNSDPHDFSHNHDSRSRLPNDEQIRESMQNFTVTASSNTKQSRPFKPGPQRARRGGARAHDRRWHSSLSLPKRAINYDLAESFLDHSTNPLSSNLYKVKFKHSTKQWPNGRFINYKEKLDKLDGNPSDVVCTRTFSVVAKRKKLAETNQIAPTTSLLSLIDPVTQEEKKKQVTKQSTVYANLFGGGRIPKLSTTNQVKKATSMINPTPSSIAISLLDENFKGQQS
ncbi:unnamed protein product [Adineta ricciae]|uniref:Uncharacterized protein n=1 Tax=Adineta ricciae TaxID=249248 RepID=A0A814GRL5_ADIRI|nr:unnamed protein product [Adineta ricciae]CAF1248116.1 unnamed protein product [Adineta ricciae]